MHWHRNPPLIGLQHRERRQPLEDGDHLPDCLIADLHFDAGEPGSQRTKQTAVESGDRAVRDAKLCRNARHRLTIEADGIDSESARGIAYQEIAPARTPN